MVLYFLYLGCLFFSFLIGFINRKALDNRQLSILVPYLFLVFVQELGVYFFRISYPGQSTGIVYNIYRPVSVCVFGWLYYRIPVNKGARSAIRWILIIYLSIVAAIFLFISSIRVYHSQLSLAGGIAMTLFGILFLFNYFNLDNGAEEKKWRPVLWITAGIVIFYPAVNISFAFYKVIFDKNATILGTYLYNAMPRILSILMYGCFAYAFYLCRKKTST
jgi:hypothetical protein